jgi:hypothetical protein
MFTHLFFFIILSVTLFASTVEIFFSPEEMNDMGVHWENLEA